MACKHREESQRLRLTQYQQEKLSEAQIENIMNPSEKAHIELLQKLRAQHASELLTLG